MEPKINIGEVTIADYNIIMKQLGEGRLNECIDLFMRLRQLGVELQQKMQAQSSQNMGDTPPPSA